MLPDWYAHATHCHVMGTSQSGKSKFLEHCIREHILSGNGLCLIDPHGTLYRAVLEFLTYVRPDRQIVLLNPSEPDYIVPFNPFSLPPGREISNHVNRNASLLVKPWGAENTNELPTYERIVKMMLTVSAATGEPLHHAAKLLEFPKKELREWAVSQIENDYWKQQWKVLQYVHTLKEWNSHVLSTQNRLGRFLASRSIVRFMGLPKPTLRIADCIRQKAIILVNLKPSDHLDPESGKVFAALLLSQFLDAAMMNTDEPRPYFLYLDEAQNYVTNDAAQMLDQVLKTGLRLTLAHHHLGQIRDEHLRQSIDTNAKLKVLFAGLPLFEAKRYAEEFFLPESNDRWLKEVRYRYVTEHIETPYEIETESAGQTSSEGSVGEQESHSSGHTSGSSIQRGTRFVPTQRKERDGQEDWTREQVVAKLAQRLTSLNCRECYVKTPADAYLYQVPWVQDYLLNPWKVLEFEKALHKHSTPSHEADRLLAEAETRFLERGKEYESRGKSRPTKKRALSPQQ